MSVEQNKATVRRLVEEMWNQGNLDVIEELHAPHGVDNALPSDRAPGLEGIRQFVTSVRETFPDFHLVIEHLIAEGDMVAYHWTASGTHRGEYLGIPATGKRVTTQGINFFRMEEDGRIAESWGVIDNLGVLQQMGAIPTQ